MATDVRPNFYNLQTLDVQDVQQEHEYLETRLEEAITVLSLQGVTDVNGLEVTQDSVVAEPFDVPVVTQDSTRPQQKNFIDFPFDEDRTKSARAYTIFQAHANNIQRINLRIQINKVTNTSFVAVSLVTLKNPSSSTSELGEQVLTRRVFRPDDLPGLDSTQPLVLDFSGDNDRAGISVTPNNYYAILIEFTRETASQDTLRVFHSSREQASALDSELNSWLYFGTRFQQGLFTEAGAFETFTFYHKVYTSAVKVSTGSALINGKPIRVTEEQRWLGLVARGGDAPLNYVVAKWDEQTAATESAARTGNESVSRVEDTFEVKVLSAAQYDTFVANIDNIFVTLAVVQDKNILAFRTEQAFTIDPNSNLAYHDWLVTTNEQPSLAALNLLNQRPSDLVFVVDNVPFEIPLTKFDGSLAVDASGKSQKDRITQVFLDIYLDGGKNKQSLQMFVIKETSSEPPYRTFAATLTDPDNENLLSYTYPFDSEQLAVDTYYNFRAVTAAGNMIYIQDFDRVFGTQDPTTGLFTSTRAKQYQTIAEVNDLVLQIDEDLKLGESSFSSGVAGQELLGYKSQYRQNEPATAHGVSSSEAVVAVTDNLQSSNDYSFTPLPVVTREGVEIANNDSGVTNGYSAGDISLLVDGVNITYSGSANSDKGGRGSPMTIFGELLSSDKTNYVGSRVVLRNADGKDNTQQTTKYTVSVTSGGKVQFTAIGLGKGVGSEAGFEQGDKVYIYIDDRPALDANNIPVTVAFNEFSASSVQIHNLGSEKYFTGKAIVSAGDHIVAGLVQLDEGQVAIDPVNGKVYFADGETPTGTISIQYLHLDQELGNIDYYTTQASPMGTGVGTPIPNTEAAVQAAIAQGDIVIKFGGTDIRQLDCTPEGPAKITNEDSTSTLGRYEIAINPETGKIIFGEGFTEQSLVQGNNPILTADTTIEVSYYYLIPQTISTINQTFEGYDVKYDLNTDGKIDEEDLGIFNTAYGSQAGEANYIAAADFNQDGVIDNVDLAELTAHFGTSSSGNTAYKDATNARINTLFAFKQDDPTKRLEFVRAVSRPATDEALGKTILFLSKNTPLVERGVYVIVFGYPNLLEDTVNSFAVTTEVDFVRPIGYSSVDAYEKTSVSNTRSVISSSTATRVEGGKTVFDHTFIFTPPVRETSTWIFESDWDGSNIDVFSRRKAVTPLEYEVSQRQVKGPFDIILGGSQFDPDGTFLELAIGPRDAFFANGIQDNDGRLIHGVPIETLRFKVIVRVPRSDASNTVDEWVWHNLQVDSNSKLIRIGVNPFLQEDHVNKGRNGKTVLQPFGVTTEQISLKPAFANGDIKNDLSNVLVFREEDSNKAPTHIHEHISADNVFVNNASNFCDFQGVEPRLTSVLCELKRDIQSNIQVGDFGNELVFISGISSGYGGTKAPIRIPTRIGDVCYEACGPVVTLNPSTLPGTVSTDEGDYYYDSYGQCPSCECLVQVKVGRVECGYFEVEYNIDPCYRGQLLLNMNWAACGYVCDCPPDEPPPPIIGEVTPFQECTYHFRANVECSQQGEPVYFWDLGDGINTSNAKEFDFEYSQPGTYKVTLVATCPDGRTFRDEVIIVVS